MALSNIFREPRRELTESAVGIGIGLPIILAVGYADWQIALWLYKVSGSDNTIPIPVGLILGLIAIIIATVFLSIFLGVTHEIGDRVCNFLDRRGVYLRPRNRYQDWLQ